jgi:hypothetical protein
MFRGLVRLQVARKYWRLGPATNRLSMGLVIRFENLITISLSWVQNSFLLEILWQQTGRELEDMECPTE